MQSALQQTIASTTPKKFTKPLNSTVISDLDFNLWMLQQDSHNNNNNNININTGVNNSINDNINSNNIEGINTKDNGSGPSSSSSSNWLDPLENIISSASASSSMTSSPVDDFISSKLQQEQNQIQLQQQQQNQCILDSLSNNNNNINNNDQSFFSPEQISPSLAPSNSNTSNTTNSSNSSNSSNTSNSLDSLDAPSTLVKKETDDISFNNNYKLVSLLNNSQSNSMNPSSMTDSNDLTKQSYQPKQMKLLKSPNTNLLLDLNYKLRKQRQPKKRLTPHQKQAHNKVEKRYRININTKIAKLQQIIPWVASEDTAFEVGDIVKKQEDESSLNDAIDDNISNDHQNNLIIDNKSIQNNCNTKLNKSMILEKAVDYILYMQNNERLFELEVQTLKNEVRNLKEGNI